jgi:hypothetical protein
LSMRADPATAQIRSSARKSAAAVIVGRPYSLARALPSFAARHAGESIRWLQTASTMSAIGSVFCRFCFQSRMAVLSIPSVNSIVSFGNRPAEVPEEEIDGIKAMIASGLPVGPWPYLEVGQTVCIDHGPLAGLTGVLVREKDAWRVVLTVEMLHRSVAVEIDRDDLGPVNFRSPPDERCRRSGVFRRVCFTDALDPMNSNISRTISSKCRALVYPSAGWPTHRRASRSPAP